MVTYNEILEFLGNVGVEEGRKEGIKILSNQPLKLNQETTYKF